MTHGTRFRRGNHGPRLDIFHSDLPLPLLLSCWLCRGCRRWRRCTVAPQHDKVRPAFELHTLPYPAKPQIMLHLCGAERVSTCVPAANPTSIRSCMWDEARVGQCGAHRKAHRWQFTLGLAQPISAFQRTTHVLCDLCIPGSTQEAGSLQHALHLVWMMSWQ